MTQGPLFIIRTCHIGDGYRKNFASYWSFERLLQERPAYLQSLQDNIVSADYEHAVSADAAEIVIKRINLCLSLNSDEYAAASKKNEEGQLVVERLKHQEQQSARDTNSSTFVEVA